MIPREIRRRLERLEPTRPKRPMTVRTFTMQGPAGCDAKAFLRSQGHDLDTPDLCIIRRVVDVRDGEPVDLPLADLTHIYDAVPPGR